MARPHELYPYQYTPTVRKQLHEELRHVDVSQLSDFELDLWVAVAEGYVVSPYICRDEAHMVNGDSWVLPGERMLPSGDINGYCYYPSNNTLQSAVLIDKHNVKSRVVNGQWNSVIPGTKDITHGETKSESSMRCIVLKFKNSL